MNRSEIRSTIFGGTIAAGLFTTVAALSLTAGVEDSLDGMLDLPVKHYAAEVLLGASDGMKESGWSNFSIEERLAAVKEATHPAVRIQMKDIYDQAYEQGLAGEWDEAALDGYLEVVEMPKSDIYRINQSTLEGDEKANPAALQAKIEADYGARWDHVGQHFREGLEGIILTTVTSTEYTRSELTGGYQAVTQMQIPIRRAVEIFGFMNKGPVEPTRTAKVDPEIQDVYLNRPRLEIKAEPLLRSPIDATKRQEVAVELKRDRIPVTWEVMSGRLYVEDPFAAEPAAQKTAADEPDI